MTAICINCKKICMINWNMPNENIVIIKKDFFGVCNECKQIVKDIKLYLELLEINKIDD